MYRKLHNGQLSIEEFYLPFGGKLVPDNRWMFGRVPLRGVKPEARMP
jgi:hypothetical protein